MNTHTYFFIAVRNPAGRFIPIGRTNTDPGPSKYGPVYQYAGPIPPHLLGPLNTGNVIASADVKLVHRIFT